MFGIGVPEFILILVIGLIVFGPGKLPEMARSLGKGMREFKKATNALSQAINEPLDTPVRPQQQAATQQPAAQPQPAPTPTAQPQPTASRSAEAPTPAPTSAPAAPTPTVAPTAAPTDAPVTQQADESQFYTIQRGDTLSKIAKQFYGNANKYMYIVEENTGVIQDPDKIYAGQVIRIPPLKG